MRESSIERAVVEYAKTLGCLVYKLNGRHDPDRLFVAPDGHVFFIEFKAPGCKARPGQIIEHERLRGFGHPVYVVESTIRGKDIVRLEAVEAGDFVL
jgi:hypothetical protein